MNKPYDIANDDGRIVYVRPVMVRDLPEDVADEVREHAGDLDQIYAVHDQSGERIALVKDRSMAFVLARQNELEPVTVH
jgi:hypothetical protein